MLMSSNDQVARLEGGITYDVQMRVRTGYMAKSSARLVAFVGEISCSELGNSGHRIDYSMSVENICSNVKFHRSPTR